MVEVAVVIVLLGWLSGDARQGQGSSIALLASLFWHDGSHCKRLPKIVRKGEVEMNWGAVPVARANSFSLIVAVK